MLRLYKCEFKHSTGRQGGGNATIMRTDQELEEEGEKIAKKRRDNLNLVTNFLNYFEKDYEIKSWESGEGVDIIIHEASYDNENHNAERYTITLSLYDTGILNFERSVEVKESGEEEE